MSVIKFTKGDFTTMVTDLDAPGHPRLPITRHGYVAGPLGICKNDQRYSPWQVIHLTTGLGAAKGHGYERLKDAKDFVSEVLAIPGAIEFYESITPEDTWPENAGTASVMEAILEVARRHDPRKRLSL